MRIAILVRRGFPEFPRIVSINGKTVFISRIYTEPPAKDESPGWANWTEENKPYYKFKYTTKNGDRIVFIIPKTVKLSIEEFSKAVERKRWFQALKKWATPGYEEFEVNDCLTEQLIEKMYTLLTKREMWCCGELVKKWLSEIPEMVKKLEGLETVDSEGVYFRFCKEFNHNVLPFTVSIEIVMSWSEFSELVPVYSPIRDYARLILEIMRDPEFIEFERIPEKRENMTRYLGRVIEILWEKNNLRIDFREKIVLWLKYQKHFEPTYID